jgi:hypothetical protein
MFPRKLVGFIDRGEILAEALILEFRVHFAQIVAVLLSVAPPKFRSEADRRDPSDC